ncbi:hypothetical protein C8R44DRAFT_887907 [Mycena epipterygia]|nr:hypothetical protein C8R44DRAFT_887907 [Mycena epipterygia]
MAKDLDAIMGVVSLCDATSNIYLHGFGHHKLLPLLTTLPLQRLSTNLSTLFPPAHPDFSHPLWASNTHLDLSVDSRFWSRYGWETWSGVGQMPCLTHLSFHNNPKDYILIYHGVLLHCKSLQVLTASFGVACRMLPLVPGYAPIATDPRFVMLVITNLIADWEMGARGSEDHWIRADKLVRKQCSGEIKSE